MGIINYIPFFFINLYMQGSIVLRSFVSKQSTVAAILITLCACALKQVFIQMCVKLWLPKLKANFAATDSLLFGFNAILTFGTRLLITSIQSVPAILAISVSTSMIELGTSTFVLHLTKKNVARLEHELSLVADDKLHQSKSYVGPLQSAPTAALMHVAAEGAVAAPVMASARRSSRKWSWTGRQTTPERQTTPDMSAGRASEAGPLMVSTATASSNVSFMSMSSKQKTRSNLTRSEELLLTNKRLLAARRQMSTEVIHLVNDFFAEFYCTAAAVICGEVFRRSEVVTLLNSELDWEELPQFFAVQYIPELADGWFIIVYLRWIGIDWWSVAKSLRADIRVVAMKTNTVFVSLLFMILAAMSRD